MQAITTTTLLLRSVIILKAVVLPIAAIRIITTTVLIIPPALFLPIVASILLIPIALSIRLDNADILSMIPPPPPLLLPIRGASGIVVNAAPAEVKLFSNSALANGGALFRPPHPLIFDTSVRAVVVAKNTELKSFIVRNSIRIE